MDRRYSFFAVFLLQGSKKGNERKLKTQQYNNNKSRIYLTYKSQLADCQLKKGVILYKVF
jgi:hypothetical protein